ncbi:hypothetical protein J2Z69_001017 [Paenibacillus shirakamiensis]|uniref:Uncharacterized protein n=1 Tax=Paenibacillus shirakamiensis TaxID=1265935 RepID=A0ABS4JE40_9BACL|nr:hypothetical protein [Paenibacillus shirakamiensis]
MATGLSLFTYVQNTSFVSKRVIEILIANISFLVFY